jgi:nucleoid DNA-binding protein
MEKNKMKKNEMEKNKMEKNKMEKNKMEKLLSMVFYGADNEETFEKQAIYIVNNMLEIIKNLLHRKEIINLCVFYIFTKFIVRTTRVNAPVLHKLFFNRF